MLHLQVVPLQIAGATSSACMCKLTRLTCAVCGIFACRCTHGVLEPFGPWPVCGTGYPIPSAQQGTRRRGSKQRRRTVMTRGRGKAQAGLSVLKGDLDACLFVWNPRCLSHGMEYTLDCERGGLLRPGAWKARNSKKHNDKSLIPHCFATGRVSKRSRRGDLLVRTSPLTGQLWPRTAEAALPAANQPSRSRSVVGIAMAQEVGKG